MLDYRHLINMTDKNGMLQFSKKSTPDPYSGYTLDDNARALIVALEMENGYLLARHYADFLCACQQGNSWSNFMLDGHFSHQFDSEDSFGRAIMACCLGQTVCRYSFPLRPDAAEKSSPNFKFLNPHGPLPMF